MASMEVEVLSRKLIRPSNPTPNHLRKLGLSLFDQLAPAMYYSVIFYYSGPDDNRAKKKAERLAQLEKSLSDALSSFFLLAGRFQEDDVSVDCGDQGVEYVEAQVNKKLSDFIKEGPRVELLDKLLPWDSSPPPAKSVTSPLVGIQINTFDCGGVAIGMYITHLLADAASMGAFINAWATASRDGVGGVLCPTSSFHHHEIASLFPARISSRDRLPIPPVPKPTQHADNEAKIVTKRFIFDQTVIASIKESAMKGKGDSIAHIKASKIVLALALLWKAFMGLAVAKHGYLRDSVLVVAMNLRGRLSLKISKECFGNFCIPVVVPFVANKDKMELHDLIILLGDTVRNTSSTVAEASSEEDVSTILIDSRRELTEKRDLTDGLDVYLCSSWCRFPLYEADFGWGKPFWVSVSTQPGQGVWLMDTNNGNGIEVWVSLKEKDMVQFKRDPDILASLSKQL